MGYRSDSVALLRYGATKLVVSVLFGWHTSQVPRQIQKLLGFNVSPFVWTRHESMLEVLFCQSGWWPSVVRLPKGKSFCNSLLGFLSSHLVWSLAIRKIWSRNHSITNFGEVFTKQVLPYVLEERKSNVSCCDSVLALVHTDFPPNEVLIKLLKLRESIPCCRPRLSGSIFNKKSQSKRRLLTASNTPTALSARAARPTFLLTTAKLKFVFFWPAFLVNLLGAESWEGDERRKIRLGSQHLSPNVKTLCYFEPQNWPEMITSRDAKSAPFKGSRMSCDLISLFWGAEFSSEKITSREGCFLLLNFQSLAVHWMALTSSLTCLSWTVPCQKPVQFSQKLLPNKFPGFFPGHVIPYLTGYQFSNKFSGHVICVPSWKIKTTWKILEDFSGHVTHYMKLNNRKPGNHPNFEKKALEVKRLFWEQLSEFRGILGATLGMALTT